MLGPSLWGLVDDFRAGLNRLVAEAFRAVSISSHFDVDTNIDGFIVRLSEGTASDDGDGSTKGRNVVDPPADPAVIEL